MSGNFRGIKSNAVFDSTNSHKINANTIKAGNVISENIQTSSFTTNITNTVIHTSIVVEGTYTVNTSGDPQYILVFDTINNNTGSVTFTIDADTSSASINDRVILMFKVTNPNAGGDYVVNMYLGNQFFYTACGDVVDHYNIANFERMVIEFIYDGEKYVCTNDNC
jgi:hypothetical protein